MTRDEIVTALRCHCDAIETGVCPKDKCPSFERPARYKCGGVVCGEAADLIENQQRHIEALLQANAALCQGRGGEGGKVNGRCEIFAGKSKNV